MGNPRDEKDAAQDLARDLADIAGQLASLKGESMALRLQLQHPQAGTRGRTEAVVKEDVRRLIG